MIHNCFKCNKKLESAFGEDEPEHYQAVTFQASGNYGSEIFDPVTSSPVLIILICDECLTQYKTYVVMKQVTYQVPVNSYEEFDPDNLPM